MLIMMDLKMSESIKVFQKILDTPTDEKTGAHAKRGFRYQDWWSTLKTFELWSKSNLDFVIGTEVKEDLIVLDSFTNPTLIEFYQIKKKETGLWKINELTQTFKRVKAEEKSILSKLYERHLSFYPIPSKLFFVSNAKLKALNIENIEIEHSKSNFKNDLHTNIINTIDIKLKKQLHLIEQNTIDYSILNFEITNMSVDEPETHVMGKVLNLNESNKFPKNLKNIKIAVNYIANEFGKMSSNTNYATNINQILERCMTRDNLEDIISNIEKTKKTLEDYMSLGLSELEKEGYSFLKRRKLIQPSHDVLLSIRDRSKIEVQELFKNIHYIYNDLILYIETLEKLGEIVDYLTNEIIKKYNGSFSIEYIKCSIIIYIISDGEVYCERYFNI